ncbi:MAG: hypothetical protein HY822_19635 [Acidobacteria bacterium]|nr:hypothetical protein [Acidobacteriota bacterium]
MNFFRMALLAGLTAATLAAQAPKLEPLPVSLPKPLFEGTPVPTNVPNLEKPLGRPRPPFLAPAGAVNVALKKPVSGSDSDPVIGNLDMITDGNKAGTDGSFVELKPGAQSVVIDLESKCAIYAVLVWHYLKEARAYADVVVQVADDPDFIASVRTIFNNDSDNAAGLGIGKDLRYVETAEGKLIDARGVEARYIRFVSNGSDKTKANHYVEIEVFGKAGK